MNGLYYRIVYSIINYYPKVDYDEIPEAARGRHCCA